MGCAALDPFRAPAAYEAPAAALPQATANVQLSYAASPSPFVDASVYVGDRPLTLSDAAVLGDETTRIALRAQKTRVTFYVVLSHGETQEPSSALVPTRRLCGGTPDGWPRVCYGQRGGVNVVDVKCEVDVVFTPAAGSEWDLAFRLDGEGRCRASATPRA